MLVHYVKCYRANSTVQFHLCEHLNDRLLYVTIMVFVVRDETITRGQNDAGESVDASLQKGPLLDRADFRYASKAIDCSVFPKPICNAQCQISKKLSIV